MADETPWHVAVLDDWQQVALSSADWSPVTALGGGSTVTAYDDHVTDVDALAERLADAHVVVLMRERTPFPGELVERLPSLRLVVTTGRRNPVVEVAACRARGVPVCGTRSLVSPTVELTWALVHAANRHLEREVAAVRSGGWQTTVGHDLAGATLGVVGPGRIGSAVARVGRAHDMEVLAWSPSYTDERAAADGTVRAASLAALLAASDVVTVHVPLTDATRGLLDATRVAGMREGALLVNTARSAVVDLDAVLAALDAGRLRGAALDVHDLEPLPADHPVRTHPRVLPTPHLGYVTRASYACFFGDVVEDVAAFARGEVLRGLG